MMILNLGVDNSGKTTLSKRILEENPQMKFIPPLGPLSKETQTKFIKASLGLLDEPVDILYERYPLLDEIVYGLVLREPNFTTESEIFKYWVKYVRVRPHLIIYNRPDLDVMISTIKERNQMEGVVDNLIELVDNYDKLIKVLKGYGMNIVIQDFTKGTQKILKRIEREIVYG